MVNLSPGNHTRSRSGSPLPPLPVSTRPHAPKYTSRRSLFTFIATAVTTGILFHFIFISLGGSESVPVLKEWIPQRPTEQVKVVYKPCPIEVTGESLPTSGEDTTQNQVEDANLEVLREMVSKTKGYYGRDYSLGLGWNNVRYIIEASLLHAALLNRTLVVPSFVYARSCEWDIQVCAAFAPMVNRGDAIGLGEWRGLPIEKQMGWRVPIDMMIDLPHLQKTHNILRVHDYLLLHGLSPTLEWSNGAWHPDYHSSTPKPTLHTIPNHEYDPQHVVRVESLSGLGPINRAVGDTHENRKLMDKLGPGLTLNYDDARNALGGIFGAKQTDEELEKTLAENGWATLHTFAGAVGMDYFKAVIQPIRQTAPIIRLKGFADDYAHIDADVVILQGETHYGRKPGAMRFVSPAARDEFAAMVLYGFRPIERIRRLGRKIASRMQEKVDGRMWLAGHMRRGDFVGLGWAMESSLESHFDRIKKRLSDGRSALTSLHKTKDLKPYAIPNATVDLLQLHAPPPQDSDPFYLATDERSPEGRKYMKDNGAIFVNDLITLEDRQAFGWPILLTDVVGVLEQYVLSRAYYFYAHGMSSVAGGAANLRAMRGADPRTMFID